MVVVVLVVVVVVVVIISGFIGASAETTDAYLPAETYIILINLKKQVYN
jgi:hypothetical protein